MENVGTISSRALLQRIGTSFGLNTSKWHSDGLEWIGEGIGLVGYHCGFDYTPIKIQVKNYRALIPSNLESIEKVYYNGYRLILGVDRSDYGFVRREDGEKQNILTSIEVLELSKEIDRLNALRLMTLTDDVANAIADSIFKINMLTEGTRLAANINNVNFHWYNVEGRFFKTSFECGDIEVEGRTFKVDSEGYPLVISTEKYKEAVSWWAMYKMLLSGRYTHPELKWKEAYQMWEEWNVKAQNEQKMPSIDQLERFTNRWNSIKRDTQLVTQVDDL